MTTYPSFKAQYGRNPVPGKDFDPDSAMCQDDYEYFGGTGRYSDTPSVATPDERRFIRREIINKYLHLGYKTVGSLRQCVRFEEVEQFGYQMITYSPWDGFDFGGGIDDPRY